LPVAIEFYNFIVPISVIEQKYPGGWEQCLKEYSSPAVWYDEHLFRTGAMDPMDIEDIVKEWEKMGFTMAEKKNGKKVWKDFCAFGSLSRGDWPCEWLEVDPERWCAYLKGTDPDGLVYGMLFPWQFRVTGAMIGDIAGSGYEWHNVKHKPDRLIRAKDKFTDDTVLTYAVAFGIIEGMKKVDRSVWMTDAAMQDIVEKEIALAMKRFARKYPKAGYGSSFRKWFQMDSLESCDSWGNGSAMRVSFAGWYADSLEEAELLGTVSARFTHNHPEGIKGAVVIAGCIYLLRTGHGKEEVREYARKYYDIDFTLDEIRLSYKYDVSCAGSVPQAIVAFLENDSFEDAIRAAISIGGDSDTIAAIAGSLAEACYPIPEDLRSRAWDKLDSGMKFAVRTVNEVLRQNRPEDYELD
jgi:type I restriction enzyme M protein